MKSSLAGKCIILICIVGLFTGCARQSENNQNVSEDVKETFVNMCFTTDYNNRYTSYGQIEDTEELTQKYYAQFAELTTEECLNDMIASRIPFSWDKYATENDMKITVKETSFNVYDEEHNVYSFSLTAEVDGKEGIEDNVITGQITVSEEDGEEKISNIYM